ncbi:DUF2298 domain-containing protein [Paraconexibacter algicola]|uniref:YYY domain-containing protein n=1 Tax=Paraconexibacter algicola TaxID=2133960 RepID=A0A2T4UKV9_9ACTN|nr:DUF2298 domain-containing protein [Paraconexibacter algicola]PTL59845.1 hypothetical protein C7Y72_09370 [Paraconexibacter algicola]
MADALAVLALAGALGLAGLPPARVLLAGLPGGGAGVARPLALLLAGFAVWLLVSLGIGAVTAPWVWLGILAVAALGLGVHRATPRREPDPTARALVIGAEVAFVAFFVLGCLLAAFAPDVLGTEKPSDMMLLHATMGTDRLPPTDLWLAGQEVNYYYFGSYLIGFVGTALGIEPDRVYNLGIGLTFGLSASAVFGVAGGLAARVRPRRAVLAGTVATGFTVLASNLEGLRIVLDHDGPLRALSWFDASRVTPGGIDDFPFFATMLGDLHAHLLAIPFVLLGAALAAHAWLRGPWAGPPAVAAARAALTGLTVGALYAMHSWNVPGAVGLLIAAGAGWWWRRPPQARDARSAMLVVAWMAAVAVAAVVLLAPFLLAFEPGTDGTGAVDDRQDLWHLLGRLGLTQGVLLAVALLALATRAWRAAAVAVGVALLLGLLGASVAGPVLLLGLAGVALAVAARGRDAPTGFAFVLVGAALVSLLLPEVVYVRDAFDGGPFERQNTIFKFTFSAWVLLGAGSGALLAAVWSDAGRTARTALAGAVLVAAVASAVFVVAGPYARTGGFAEPAQLGGMRWLERSAPGDVAAIRWLRDRTARDAVVLEAAGPDYTTAGRIAMFSGRATVIAWAGHHLVWNQDIGRRETEVATVYAGTDPAAARAVLRRYGVDYVVVGALERTTYPGPGLRAVAQLGTRAFAAPDGTVVYRVR